MTTSQLIKYIESKKVIDPELSDYELIDDTDFSGASDEYGTTHGEGR